MERFKAVETKSDNHVGGWIMTTDAAKIWVDVYGNGRPIILLHGWTMSSAFWKRQLTLSKRYQIITIDFRGHGKSPSTLRGQTIPRYARDVREVIRALRLRDALLLGWSMGGSVAMEYWQKYGGDALSAISFVETGPYPMASAPWNIHAYRNNNIHELESDMDHMVCDRESFGTRFINNMFLSGEAPSHAFSWMLSEQLAVSNETARTIYEDYVSRDQTPILPSISIPSLVIYGRSKHMCFGPSTGRFVAASIPGSRFVILENSGHVPFYEEPESFNSSLSSFFDQIK